MYVKKLCKLLLPLVLALGLLAGCGRAVYSSRAVSAVNKAQTVVSFTTSTELDNALRKAVQAGSDLTAVRDALLKELEYSDAAYFSVSGVRSARAGQHAVQVYRVSGGASAAAECAAKEIASVLKALRTGGEYTGCISMVKYDGSYYIAVDLTIVKQAPSSSSSSDGGDEEPSEPTAQSIAVSGLEKTYTVGDEINTDKLTVTVTFSDGTTKELGTDEYAIDYDFSSKGEKDVTVTYKADPSVSCTVTITVQAAYEGKRIAVFMGYGAPVTGEDCEWANSNVLPLPDNKLKSALGEGISIVYLSNSPLARAMAATLQNHSIDLETLHNNRFPTNYYEMVDFDSILENIEPYQHQVTYVVAEVEKTDIDVDHLEDIDKQAAQELNDMLYNEIKEKAPDDETTVKIDGVEYKMNYNNHANVGLIREHLGERNFRYYAAAELLLQAVR